MAQKVILIVDPGIDTAFAVALALFDPRLEVLALAPTAGNVVAQQATINVHTLIAQLDPPRWPRLGAALPISYEVDGRALHGTDGLGNSKFPEVSLHAPQHSDKLIVELVHKHPNDVTIICMGPATTLQSALHRDPTLPQRVHRVILLGGSWREPGNVSAAAEFHFFCDPEAAREVLHSKMPITLVPLDVMRKIVFSPSDLLELPSPDCRVSKFLRQIVPFGIRACSNLYGIEGFHMKDVMGVVAQVLPQAISTRSVYVDVETRGELTRGMSIVDVRPNNSHKPNVELVTTVDVGMVRDYIFSTLRGIEAPEL
jgi:inosine-uridine nucleoside N-ribohydrolase